MPNVPVNQGWPRIQATTSWPSSTSDTMGSKVPPEPKVPRHETLSTLYPRSAKTRANGSAIGNERP